MLMPLHGAPFLQAPGARSLCSGVPWTSTLKMGGDDGERRMTLGGEAVVLLVLVGTGCATARVVRLDTGEGQPIIYTPRADAEPVELDEDEFAEAVQKLARTAP